MTARPRTRPTASDDAVADFHAAVGHLVSLDTDAFAELATEDLEPIIATIRATSREVPRS